MSWLNSTMILGGWIIVSELGTTPISERHDVQSMTRATVAAILSSARGGILVAFSRNSAFEIQEIATVRDECG